MNLKDFYDMSDNMKSGGTGGSDSPDLVKAVSGTV